MVSTTLTTIAAGQPTSSSNHHSHQSTAPPSTANNSNYQRSATASQQQQQQQLHHSSSSTSSTRNSYYYNSLTLNGNDTAAKTANVIQTVLGAAENNHNSYHYQRPTTLYNGKASNSNSSATVSATAATPVTTTATALTPSSVETAKSEQATAKLQHNEATKPTVNLSQALLSASPPLNDQISLLFPKCRPKHVTSSSNNHSIGNGSDTADGNLNSQLRNGETSISVSEADSSSLPAKPAAPLVTIESATSPTAVASAVRASTANYYKSVNIITQSPPPPSTSSVSSESLSSVTPRISTNPFLCSTLSNGGDDEGNGPVNTHKLSEEDEESENLADHNDDDAEEELPVPTYPTSFYYHTASYQHHNQQQQQQQQQHKLTSEAGRSQRDEKRINEMPRKRSSYNNGYNNHHPPSTHHQTQQQSSQHQQQYAHLSQSQIIAAVNHHHQQQQQQQHQQQAHHQQHNGNAGDSGHPSQNPFIKDNYWETRHNITPASTVLNSPDYSGPDLDMPAVVVPPPSSRRAFHQQSYNSSSSSTNYMPRQQHHIRVGRSPVNHSEQVCGEATSKRSYHHQQQQQQAQNPCSEGLTPLASHYLYGSKTSLEQQHASNDWERERGGSIVSDRAERECRERDREQREQQRKVFVERERGREHHQQQDMRDMGRDIGQQQHKQQHQHQQQQQHQQKKQHQQRSNAEGRLSVITNGEVVVFDDIAESWQNLRVTTDPSATRTTPTAAHSATAPTIQQQQQGSLTLAGIKDDKTEVNNCDTEAATMYKDHKRYLDRNYAITVETRHGIIEYEGSPRRIGHSGSMPDDEPLPGPSSTSTSQQPQMTKTSQQTQQQHQVSTSANSSSPQQSRARPGFPQRIISPPRESTPPIMLLNNYKQQQQQLQQQQQQQHSHSLLPQQSSPTDTNAEDTSNDVSEIGTISDLTTPEAISTSGAGILLASMADSASATVTATTPTATATTVTAATTNGTTTNALSIPTKSSTFDYLYEFSETRKVLEEFFKCPSNDGEKAIENGSDVDSIDIQYEFQCNVERDDEDDEDVEEVEDEVDIDELGIDDNEDLQRQQQQHLPHQSNHHQAQQQQQQQQTPHTYQYQQQQQQQPQLNHTNSYTMNNHRRHFTGSPLMRDFDFFLDSASRSSGEQIDQQDGINHNQIDGRQNYHYSPETTDYDSNCGDLDSLSGEMNGGVSTSCSNYAKYHASSMPVLEDGLSSGHTSDTENNNHNNMNHNLTQPAQNSTIHHTPVGGGISMLMDIKRISTNNSINSMNNTTASTTDGGCGNGGGGVGGAVDQHNSNMSPNILHESYLLKNESPINGVLEDSGRESVRSKLDSRDLHDPRDRELLGQSPSNNSNCKVFKNIDPDLDSLYSISVFHRPDMVQMTPPPPAPAPHRKPNTEPEILQPTPYKDLRSGNASTSPTNAANIVNVTIASAISSTLNRPKASLPNASIVAQATLAAQQATNRPTPSQPPPIPERNLQRSPSPVLNSPVWLPRHLDTSVSKSLLESSSGNHSKNQSADEEDVDTDLETDRLLGHQRLDDQGYYDENKSWEQRKSRSLLSKISPKQQLTSTKTRNGYNALLSSTPEIPPPIPPKNSANKLLDLGGSISSSEHSDKSPIKSIDVQDCVVAMGSPGGSDDGSACISGGGSKKDLDVVNSSNTNGGGGGGGSQNGVGLSGGGGNGNGSSVGSNSISGEKKVKKSKNKEGGAVLIEGVLFRAKYLGSTQLVCEGQPTKSTRMMQAEEAVSRIKAPDGDVQPSTEVDLFISTEKIMVLNTDLKEIMMDHALRTISYIADIGDLVVLMARRRFVPQDIDDAPKPNRTPKMICHVFESDEAQFIAQSIGQAFQVAYMEFLKANGIEDHSFVKEMDYQEVLNSQEIFGDELEIFAKKELQKEVVVPKAKGEILGVVIVESGWGSMLPTVVIANLMSSGAAARCGQLNIGDQLIAINGLSLVGLPLSTCQTYIKNTKNQTVVKFTVVPCAPVVEVKIKRPNTKYQLGFSVQNGVICSLLRGGIAERGGVRVGHRIIEINNQSVVAVPHEKIVNLLATSVGEILMKTMPTSMFRLLTGQENPIYI